MGFLKSFQGNDESLLFFFLLLVILFDNWSIFDDSNESLLFFFLLLVILFQGSKELYISHQEKTEEYEADTNEPIEIDRPIENLE